MRCAFLALLTLVLLAAAVPADPPPVRIGSKQFPESIILGEIMAQWLEHHGRSVERKFGFQGTNYVFNAVKAGHVDVYAEYSGTLAQSIMRLPAGTGFTDTALAVRKAHGLHLLPAFGFNNTWVVIVRRAEAESFGVRRISDLTKHTSWRFAFPHEFNRREDGWLGLKRVYGFAGTTPEGIETNISYRSLRDKHIDVTAGNSTDGYIGKYGLLVLEDDRGLFPEYLAAPLVRSDLDTGAVHLLTLLAGKVSEARMMAMNERALDGGTPAQIAAAFLRDAGLIRDGAVDDARGQEPFFAEITTTQFWGRVLRHVLLTLVALACALLVALPLTVFIHWRPVLASPVLKATAIVQTIPSLALLAIMIPIPFLGIGVKPAITALALYALLPIVQNGYTGFQSIDRRIIDVAVGMGLTRWQVLRKVELPLALPTLLAGIKTAAVISVGTATIAALVKAGGLGEYILEGLALSSNVMILQGAIPAALLAVGFELMFRAAEAMALRRQQGLG